MQKISMKRRITLPKELCIRAGINTGDLIEFFECEGQITVIKKQKGASAGILRHLSPCPVIADEESLLGAIQQKKR